jgi:hypothetical protein
MSVCIEVVLLLVGRMPGVEDPPVESRCKGELQWKIGSFLVAVLLSAVRGSVISIPELKDREVAYA